MSVLFTARGLQEPYIYLGPWTSAPRLPRFLPHTKNMLTPSQSSTANLEALSAELKLMILENLDHTSSLDALVQASSTFEAIYKTFHVNTYSKVLLREIIFTAEISHFYPLDVPDWIGILYGDIMEAEFGPKESERLVCEIRTLPEAGLEINGQVLIPPNDSFVVWNDNSLPFVRYCGTWSSDAGCFAFTCIPPRKSKRNAGRAERASITAEEVSVHQFSL